MESKKVKNLISYLETETNNSAELYYEVKGKYDELFMQWITLSETEKDNFPGKLYTTLKEYEEEMYIIKFKTKWLQSQLSLIKEMWK